MDVEQAQRLAFQVPALIAEIESNEEIVNGLRCDISVLKINLELYLDKLKEIKECGDCDNFESCYDSGELGLCDTMFEPMREGGFD